MHEKQPNTNAPKKNLLSVPPLATVQNKLTEMIPTAKRAAMTALATGMLMAGATGCSSQVQAQDDSGVYIGGWQFNPDGTADQSTPDDPTRTHFVRIRTGVIRVNRAYGPPPAVNDGGEMSVEDAIFTWPHLEEYIKQFIGGGDIDTSMNRFVKSRCGTLWREGYEAYMAAHRQAGTEPGVDALPARLEAENAQAGRQP